MSGRRVSSREGSDCCVVPSWTFGIGAVQVPRLLWSVLCRPARVAVNPMMTRYAHHSLRPLIGVGGWGTRGRIRGKDVLHTVFFVLFDAEEHQAVASCRAFTPILGEKCEGPSRGRDVRAAFTREYDVTRLIVSSFATTTCWLPFPISDSDSNSTFFYAS